MVIGEQKSKIQNLKSKINSLPVTGNVLKHVQLALVTRFERVSHISREFIRGEATRSTWRPVSIWAIGQGFASNDAPSLALTAGIQ